MSRLRSILAAAVVTAASVVGPAASASAACPTLVQHLGICPPLSTLPATNPGTPTPNTPGSGTSGMFDGTPAGDDTLYGQYGFAPLHWDTYNLPTFVTNVTHDTNANLNTFLGGMLFGAAVDIVALSSGLSRLIAGDFLTKLDAAVAAATGAIYRTIWTEFLPIAFAAVGLGIIVSGGIRRNFSKALRSAGWSLGVLVAVAYVSLASTQLSGVADHLVANVTNNEYAAVDSPTAEATPAAATADEVKEILYPLWLRGELGSSTSATAVKYGPLLYDANGYTWAETGGNGEKAPSAEVTKEKSQEWTVAAKAIAAHDPAAAKVMSGAGDGRIATGFIAVIAATLTSGFRFVAAVATVGALLEVRLAMILLPALALIGIFAQFSGVLTGLLRKVLHLIGAAVLLSLGAAINILLVGICLSPAVGMSIWLGVVVAGTLTYLLWKTFKYVGSYLRTSIGATEGSLVGGLATAGAGVASGALFEHRKSQRRDARMAGAIVAATGVGAVAGVVAEHVIHDREEAVAPEPVELPSEETAPTSDEEPSVSERPVFRERPRTPISPWPADPASSAYRPPFRERPRTPIRVPETTEGAEVERPFRERPGMLIEPETELPEPVEVDDNPLAPSVPSAEPEMVEAVEPDEVEVA